MGVESFDVLLESALSVAELATILVEQGLRVHVGAPCHKDEAHYVYEDDAHVIEFELSRSNSGSSLAARFALCQSPTVDNTFATLVTMIAGAAQADLKIRADVSELHGGTFSLRELEAAGAAIRRAAREERAAWIRDFGGRDTKASCDEAVTRFLINR